ncbi:MAG: TIGR04282 family arsenosugar biosynthesis glycosyltransferase [Ginsengibacter sp.]
MTENALIIFVKNLIKGHVKTRLANTLGDDAAMEIYKQLLKNAHDKIQSLDVDKIVFYSEFIEDDIWENNLFQKEIQEGNDLGERMENAFKSLSADQAGSFTAGYKKVVIVGTDCPGINKDILEDGFLKLNNSDIVIGPATDGGYYLLGMKNMYSFLFQKIKWGTDTVLQQTIDLCNRNQLSYFLLPELTDIDDEKDLIHLKNFGFKI